MRAGRFGFNLRRAMVIVAVIGLALAYAVRYRACNAIADKHQAALLTRPFNYLYTVRQIERVAYYRNNRDRYRRAAIYPWVTVPFRFVPFDPTGLPIEMLDPPMSNKIDDSLYNHYNSQSGNAP